MQLIPRFILFRAVRPDISHRMTASDSRAGPESIDRPVMRGIGIVPAMKVISLLRVTPCLKTRVLCDEE